MDLSDVTQAFLAAPLDARGWDHALRQLAAFTHSQSGQIIGINPRAGLVFNRITDTDTALIARFDREEAAYSNQNWRVRSSGRPFELRHEVHYARARAAGGSDMYDDVIRMIDQPHGCQTVLMNEPDLMIGLALLRTTRDGPTRAEERARFAEAAPFALAAARMQRAIEEQGAQLIAGSLGAMSTAAFLCDARGRVGAMTSAAQRLATTGGVIGLGGERLVAASEPEQRTLRMALNEMLKVSAAPPAYRSLWLGNALPVRERRLCELFALPQKAFNFGFAPRIMVTVRAAGDIAANERAALRALLGLTAAEAEIAALLSDGLPREAIAAKRGTSAGTVAIQIKRLFEKTGVGREAELVALVRRLLR